MFSKTALVSLALGALYVNAFVVPVAREPAPESGLQDIDARVNQNAVAAGIMAFNAATPLFPLFKSNKAKSKREADPEIEELDARAINPIIMPSLFATSNMLSKTSFFNKPRGGNKRETSDELFSREPEFEDFQDLMARANWDKIKIGISTASAVTPLVAKYAQTYRTPVPKREISDELFSREPEDWAQASKREPSPEPHDSFDPAHYRQPGLVAP